MTAAIAKLLLLLREWWSDDELVTQQWKRLVPPNSERVRVQRGR